MIKKKRKNKFNYVHIGCNVFEFETNEIIVEYVSNVGNNCVPYPYAESANWCYCMVEREKSPIEDHKDRVNIGNIYEVSTARYINLNVTKIAKRDSINTKFSLPSSKKTNLLMFDPSININMMENTCNNETTTYDTTCQ